MCDFYEEDNTQMDLIGSGSFSKVYLCRKKNSDSILQMNSLSDVFDQHPQIYVIKKIDSHRLVKKYASTLHKEEKSSCSRSSAESANSTPVNAKYLITPCSNGRKTQIESKIKPKTDYKKHYYTRVRDLIESELDVLSILRHSNIVNYFGYSTKNGIYSISLEYCHGGDLYNYLFKNNCALNNRPNINFINKLVVHVSSALKYLHHKNIIHRDIKPQNILLCSSDGAAGSDWTFKLTDFGFATFVPPKDLPKSNMTAVEKKFFKICGTPYYMAPELMTLSKSKHRVTHVSDYDHTVDVWSFGVCLYEVFTGDFPFPQIDEIDGLVPLIQFLSGGDSSSNFVKTKINMCVCIPAQYKALLLNMLKFTNRCTIDHVTVDELSQEVQNENAGATLPDKVGDSWIRISGSESSLSLPQGEQFKSTFLKWLLKH